ncbi:uncharacterized protein LOC123403197 isoform X1 [Hordeum vulgare subsp. vulgare]|uniref:OTU domain-containing protein n=1 Tax=Hordeum vulgare subsp. vulgare TaxID=112509 RepID=A0A8I6XXL0_HORVV|nr:uncharacterized protein LOC123403197 isoform X1 [Hordeum vulgare subsp. vulgare]
MEPTAGSGSGAAEPVQEPDSNASSTTAAAPPPPPASATPLHREQAGDGADGSSPATVVDPRKGKDPAPPSPPRRSSSGSSSSSSTRSHDYAAAFRAFQGAESSAAAAARFRRVTWSDPVVEETTEVQLLDPKTVFDQMLILRLIQEQVAEEVPGAAAQLFDSNTVLQQVVIERLIQGQVAEEVPDAAAQLFDSKTVFDSCLCSSCSKTLFDQVVIQRLTQEQAADEEENRRWKQQFNSLRAEEEMYRKEQEKLSQAKVKSKQDKLPQAKGKLPWSKLKNKIFRKEGREICSEHVKHQTHPITEVRRHYMLASDEANHLDAYSECRSVIGDGECFYRSFIFSYLEQVIDRQDTHEERRLLHVVKRVARQHANLRWNSEFSRSSRAFKNLIKKVKRWKRHGRWNSRKSTSSYRKEKLLNFFSEYDTTLDIFIFLRLVVAIEICSHREVYEQLIPGLRENYSLEDWCIRRVTPARRFTDHVMMLALATALEVPLRVERVRGVYHPDIYTGTGVPRPSVTLLYSGNHYEIIYPRAPSAESSSHQASQREDPTDQSSSHQPSQRDPGDQS